MSVRGGVGRPRGGRWGGLFLRLRLGVSLVPLWWWIFGRCLDWKVGWNGGERRGSGAEGDGFDGRERGWRGEQYAME